MKRLSFEALENRASMVVSLELLNSISGGTENSCHDDSTPTTKDKPRIIVDGPEQ